MRSTRLADHTDVPALGQGTWRMGEDSRHRAREIAALRAGVELGMTVIDTAEMYASGATEILVGEALAGIRDEVFLVSKVLPQNAGRGRIERACEASLARLKTDRLDLYLLHWRGPVPLEETVQAMEGLVEAGKIRLWGVSNFDQRDMEALWRAGGDGCAANQILYHVAERGPEFDLLPDLKRRRVAAMAYSPVAQGRLPSSKGLAAVAGRHGVSVFQAALAFALRDANLVAIPKAGDPEHVRENRRAADLALTTEDLASLEADFPPPRRKTPLAML